MHPRGAALRRHPRRAFGQALVLTLVFVAAAGLVGLLLFNSGLLANAKTRLQNAADAAAYSAGVLQARDHNFTAYTNRAMVANQAAVAQMVSIKSYLEDADDTYGRMKGWLLTLQALDPMQHPQWDYGLDVAGPAVSEAHELISDVAPSYVQALDALIKAHETAQQLHHVATLVDAAAVADEVIKKNDPMAKISSSVFAVGNLAYRVAEWDGSTKQHRANDDSAEADRFADLVVSDKATDGFTRNRTSVPVPAWYGEVSKTCLLTKGPNYVDSTSTFSFYHGGGTLLSENKKRWLALDATMGGGAITCTYWYPCWTGICFGTDVWPFFDALGGSGGGLAGSNGGYGGETSGYKNNPSETLGYGFALYSPAMIPANIRHSSTGPGDSLDTGGGLQDHYRDMADPIGHAPSKQTPEDNGGQYPITIEAERPASTVRTSSKLMTGSTLIKADDQLAGDTMRALSSAHAYFYRSRTDSGFTRSGWSRGDGKTEVENLFSPYWQARLVDRSDAERAASMAEQMK